VILLCTLGKQTTHLELEQEISEQSYMTTKPAAFWEVTTCNLAPTYLPNYMVSLLRRLQSSVTFMRMRSLI